jgi:DNA helicase-2/ATP-dependent DNA helicase PcrA
LNPAQQRAVRFGVPDQGRLEPGPPLLVIAGAGSGKTNTLAHRVAHLILNGADPRRMLLLTFTRRAAEAMIRRAEQICVQVQTGPAIPYGASLWSGTFHAVGARLLRLYAEQIGLDPGFTVLDRSDSADLLDLVRDQQDLSRKDRRFPRKATCLAIYSYAVNAQQPLETVLRKAFPWCSEWPDELNGLFAGYVEAKQRQHVLDYDDLLLYWEQLMAVPELAADVGARFDYLLVDEYQDTNALQASILLRMKPDGRGVTVVGDDAQAIYGFRAADVRNILEFPASFEPPAAIVTLEQNYRSTQPILAAANAVIGLAKERFTKNLFSERVSRQKPVLVSVRDDVGQVNYVVERVLAAREEGVDLKQQAVLFRPAQHSVRQIWRAEVPGGGARQGRAGHPALGREPSRRGRGVPQPAAAAGDRACDRAQGAAGDGPGCLRLRPAGAVRAAGGGGRALAGSGPIDAGSGVRSGVERADRPGAGVL